MSKAQSSKWRDVAGSVVMTAVCGFAAFTSTGIFGRVIGWIGVAFFGLGAVVIASNGRGMATMFRRSKGQVARSSIQHGVERTPIEVSAENRAAVEDILRALDRFDIVPAEVGPSDLYESSVDAAGPGRSVMVDDVLAGLGEVNYHHPDVDMVMWDSTVVSLHLDDHQQPSDIADDIGRLARLGPEELSVSFPEGDEGDPALLRAIVDGHTLDVFASPNVGPPVFAHLGAMAEIHERRWPGYRLATLWRDEQIFVVRLADGARDACNAALGIDEDHYTKFEWLGSPHDPEFGRATIDWR